MVTDTDKRVREFFSRAAGQYERHADLQKEIGKVLLKKMDISCDGQRILDIGMGTGWLTGEMTQKYPRARVFGLDFAPGMVRFAEKHYHSFRMIEADAGALPFKREMFSVVVSNAAYQWVDNLTEAFKEVRDVLCPRGRFYLSCFGRGSLQELFLSLEHSFGRSGKEIPQDNGLVHNDAVYQALVNSEFNDIEVYSEIKKLHFSDMLMLVRWLKAIGANGVRRDYFVGKQRLQRASEFYDRHFRDNGGVYATFEIIWARGTKP